MPEGPLGFPRLTDLGPLVTNKPDISDIDINVSEYIASNHLELIEDMIKKTDETGLEHGVKLHGNTYPLKNTKLVSGQEDKINASIDGLNIDDSQIIYDVHTHPPSGFTFSYLDYRFYLNHIDKIQSMSIIFRPFNTTPRVIIKSIQKVYHPEVNKIKDDLEKIRTEAVDDELSAGKALNQMEDKILKFSIKTEEQTEI